MKWSGQSILNGKINPSCYIPPVLDLKRQFSRIARDNAVPRNTLSREILRILDLKRVSDARGH